MGNEVSEKEMLRRKNISIAMTGKQRSKSHCDNMSRIRTGWKMPEHARLKLCKNWNDCSYAQKHDKVSKKYGKAYKCESENCSGNSNKFEWSNVSRTYSTIDRHDWKMLCISCHRNYDKKPRTRKMFCINNHPLFGENIHIYDGDYGLKRICKTCDRNRKNETR